MTEKWRLKILKVYPLCWTLRRGLDPETVRTLSLPAIADPLRMALNSPRNDPCGPQMKDSRPWQDISRNDSGEAALQPRLYLRS